MTIYFYTVNNEYGEFSNFSKHGVELDSLWWKTVEHYFQAQKFTDELYKEKIRNAASPKLATNLGRSREIPIRTDWEEIKNNVMRKAVLKKFQTHESLKEMLVSTGNEQLVEAAPGDYYWGSGADGSGKNMLGIILEEVRETLSNEA